MLTRRVLKLFPDPKQREAAVIALAQYGTQPHEHEAIRVRLAVLRLSGSDLQKIQINVASAKQDYRDILTSAEYPRQAGQDSWKLTADLAS